MKPEPTIKQGVPWCSEEACKHFLDIGDAPIYECTAGKFCFEIPADPETLLCLPKVQAMAAENEQLRRMVTSLFNRRHEKDRLAAEAAESEGNDGASNRTR